MKSDPRGGDQAGVNVSVGLSWGTLAKRNAIGLFSWGVFCELAECLDSTDWLG